MWILFLHLSWYNDPCLTKWCFVRGKWLNWSASAVECASVICCSPSLLGPPLTCRWSWSRLSTLHQESMKKFSRKWSEPKCRRLCLQRWPPTKARWGGPIRAPRFNLTTGGVYGSGLNESEHSRDVQVKMTTIWRDQSFLSSGGRTFLLRLLVKSLHRLVRLWHNT